MNKIEKSLRYLFDNIIQSLAVVNDETTLLEEKFQSVSIDNDLTINVEFTVVRLDETTPEESDIVVSEAEIV